MQTLTTILWDWNGTILNDVALCSNLINHQLTRHGYAPVGDLDAYRQVFCFPIERYYEKAGFDFTRHAFAQLADEYMELYVPQSLACPLQPHVAEVLETLHSRGVQQAILSASHRDILAKQAAHFGLSGYFDALIGIEDVYARSKVAVGKAWFAQSGANPATTIMVGDSVHDFDVAAALGVHCVLYSGGHQPPETLAETGVPVLSDFRELLEYFQ